MHLFVFRKPVSMHMNDQELANLYGNITYHIFNIDYHCSWVLLKLKWVVSMGIFVIFYNFSDIYSIFNSTFIHY